MLLGSDGATKSDNWLKQEKVAASSGVCGVVK